jgi:hypothetical protein
MKSAVKVDMSCFTHCEGCGRHTKDVGPLAMVFQAEGPCMICWSCYEARPVERYAEHVRILIERNCEDMPVWTNPLDSFDTHLLKLAEENRGLDHAALTRLYDEHEVVYAVWPKCVCTALLKGHEYLRAQPTLSKESLIAVMTAIPCTDREHARRLREELRRGEGAT